MTNDEFERIITAILQMRIMNINGLHMISLEGATKIIHSNLHPEDKSGWEYYVGDNEIGWRKVGDKQ